MASKGTALITGASAGIGLDLAKLFAADHHDLVLVARRKERLDALAAELTAAHGVKAHAIAADLEDARAPAAIVAEVQRLGLQIDYLVNNAGFGTTGAFHELDPAREIAEVQVNIVALMALTRAFLPAMVGRGFGRVLNVGSTAGFLPGPNMATYYATKAFVNSFTEALWYELRGTGVTATVSCPGATATEFFKVAGNDGSRLVRMGTMRSIDVARGAYRAMHTGRAIVVHGATNHITAFAVRLAPRGVLRAIAARLNARPSGSKELKA